MLNTVPTNGLPAVREGAESEVVASWEGMLWLERRSTDGEPNFMIRATIGTLPPWRIGPFDELEAAERTFAEIMARLEDGLEDLVLDAMNVEGDWVSREP